MEIIEKLAILADAAKYDASCASSGAARRTSEGGRGVGSTEGMGICHAYAPDGRCISLLKVLLTNYCSFDCLYCVNRRSSNVKRARFSVEEVVRLTLDFYKRNYIEGLFLSSGIIQSSDYTMEQLVRVARSLREEHDFRGYIHLKAIPNAADELIAEGGRWADRMSVNVELPSDASLARFAPEKDLGGLKRAMAGLRLRIDEARAEPGAPAFAPAGQSTQVIVGADGADDATILARSAELYGSYRLQRVYYSAFSPIPDASVALPLKPAPLQRENRLHQADWLHRIYGFEMTEIASVAVGGMLPLDVDPKLAWALAHRERFPVDVNRAPRETLLRTPGLGMKTVKRILSARPHRALRLDDVARLGAALRQARPFIVTADWRPRGLDDADLRRRLAPQPKQLSLFAHAAAAG